MLNENILNLLKNICGENFVFQDQETLERYSHDETEDLKFAPHCVIKPGSAEEIAAIVRLCNEYKIPITPMGARTGLSGGALPIWGGIGLSLERLNKIIEIDENNLQITVEAGVVTQTLQEAVIEKGLYYPPDPSSRGSCFIGGNIAENAGGARAVKYGVTKDFILNLEVVLPNGEIIWTGANTIKNATGYNLTQLIVGSEGTLGIVTKAVLRLVPYPSQNLLMLAPFYDAMKAASAVSAIFKAGITPSALEFIERDALEWGLKYVSNLQLDLPENVQAHLLIEVDGNDLDSLYKEAEKVATVLQTFDCGDILFADNHHQKEALWYLRRNIGNVVKSNSVYKEEDTVVPRYELPHLLKKIKDTGAKYGFQSVCYGHAGDGNLHVNIIKGNLDEATWANEVPKGIREIFEYTVQLKGTLSGEHGIGYVQKEFMPIAFHKTALDLMRNIKQVFDPNNIMNPGKIFPDE